MIYNVGDKVRLITRDKITTEMDFVLDMLDYLGKTVTIVEVVPYKRGLFYKIQEDDRVWSWHDYLIDEDGE